uniref:Protein odr-4 homolog n=1 Tax=Lates calcarifer TaxID=8187 RepID=A0A4W6EA02_LATCA
MGRGFIVEDAVEGYLSKLCEQQAGPVTGLLIGQSSSQRDFVIMATRTPQKEDSTAAPGTSLDKEWVTEHARQVFRMLPGGLSVLGVFIITDNDGKDTLTTLRQFSSLNAVHVTFQKYSSFFFSSVCFQGLRTDLRPHVDMKCSDRLYCYHSYHYHWLFQSVAKPADWKYQSGVCSSWTTVSCCVNVDMLVPLPNNRTSTENMDTCLKGLKVWANQINSGVCLIDGRQLPEDTELTAGQVRKQSAKSKKKTLKRLLTKLCLGDEQRLTDVVQQCGGSVSVRGSIHSRAYLHSNKPKAKLAEKLLKRDVVSTVATRVQMLLEEMLTSEEEKKKFFLLCVPRRVFCPVKTSGPVCVCDYQFSDEGLCELTDRLKEMLDMDAAEEDLDTRQESTLQTIHSSITEGLERVCVCECVCVAIATAVAMLAAAAASMLYLSDV